MDDPLPRNEPVIVVMGIAGTGKTTVGRRVAAALGWEFLDGDDLHPAANVAKMARGVPLTDEDRAPWLERVRERIAGYLARGTGAVVACSALKRRYRARLRVDPARVHFVHLEGDPPLLHARLAARAGHYMKAGLLDSQLAALEPPRRALAIDAALPVDAIVARIRSAIGR
ncbi:MAG TPA: gluconokinase [Burkholderiales bacterium]